MLSGQLQGWGMQCAALSALPHLLPSKHASLQSATHPHQACAPQSLRYAKAAAIVRASAVRVTPDIRGGDLPFIGDVTGVDGDTGFWVECGGMRRAAERQPTSKLPMLPARPPTAAMPMLCCPALPNCSTADQRHHSYGFMRCSGLLQVSGLACKPIGRLGSRPTGPHSA